ncbi:hypothetical protein [Advenella kashmirensis]|uniref:hypothetical protein n=1 Tax=Advenella kashmirensis TaxID=310575 RepID=UPI0004216998|nr:hypothetical protein [Advenella kashmirensis]
MGFTLYCIQVLVIWMMALAGGAGREMVLRQVPAILQLKYNKTRVANMISMVADKVDITSVIDDEADCHTGCLYNEKRGNRQWRQKWNWWEGWSCQRRWEA